MKLRKSVNDLYYPSKASHKRLADLDETSFLAGNLKDTPISKNVLKQCIYMNIGNRPPRTKMSFRAS